MAFIKIFHWKIQIAGERLEVKINQIYRESFTVIGLGSIPGKYLPVQRQK